MNKNLQNKLYEKFPNIFAGRFESPQKTCMCFGIECGDGWYNLIRNLCQRIKDLDPEGSIRAVQVKEKFGGLRFYINYGTDEIFDEIYKAEDASYETCEMCGKPGKLRDDGWLCTLCDECWEQRKNE